MLDIATQIPQDEDVIEVQIQLHIHEPEPSDKQGQSLVEDSRGRGQSEEQGPKLVRLSQPAEPEVMAVNWYYSDVEVGILQVHAGHPLTWVHDCYDGLQCLHLERSIA